MTILRITDVRDFMNKLLLGDVFDNFLLISFELNNLVKINIDGIRNKARDEDAELKSRYISWKEIRTDICALVKGGKVPDSLKGVFRLSESNTEKLTGSSALNNIKEGDNGLYFNLKFERGELNLITGVSAADFLISKELESLWEENLIKFLKYYKIEFERL